MARLTNITIEKMPILSIKDALNFYSKLYLPIKLTLYL